MLQPHPTISVCKFLRRLQEKQFKQIWKKVLGLLSEPRPNDSKKIGTCDGREVFRADSGEFRILYSFDTKKLWLVLIDKRNDDEVYKSYNRKKR